MSASVAAAVSWAGRRRDMRPGLVPVAEANAPSDETSRSNSMRRRRSRRGSLGGSRASSGKSDVTGPSTAGPKPTPGSLGTRYPPTILVAVAERMVGTDAFGPTAAKISWTPFGSPPRPVSVTIWRCPSTSRWPRGPRPSRNADPHVAHWCSPPARTGTMSTSPGATARSFPEAYRDSRPATVMDTSADSAHRQPRRVDDVPGWVYPPW